MADRAALRHRYRGRRRGLDRGRVAGAPNLVVVNPRNGHAHLVYLLGAWVQTDFGDSRRLKVVRYAAAIERAYTAALGADPAYTGRFQHNPLSDAYVTKIGRDTPYSLDELARYVDLNEPALKKNPPIRVRRSRRANARFRGRCHPWDHHENGSGHGRAAGCSTIASAFAR